ncbi:MAG: nitroreductase family protein, partial [Glaciecola sp.]
MSETTTAVYHALNQFSDVEMENKSAQFFEHMSSRHSIRSFSSKAVPRTVIENAIKTAGRAPSGANHQPWHFVAISSQEV